MYSLLEDMAKNPESFQMFVSEAENRGLLSRNMEQFKYARSGYYQKYIHKESSFNDDSKYVILKEGPKTRAERLKKYMDPSSME